MTLRVCATPGCPTLVPATAYRGRCTDCQRRDDRARGSRTARGYGASLVTSPIGTGTYDQIRRNYQRLLAVQEMACACGCGTLVNPNDWHLGHDDVDRRIVKGPMTPRCNLADAGRSRRR